MARYRQLIRCLQLSEMLKGREAPPVNVSVLAEQFKVHTRTIRRDLAALEGAGVVVPPQLRQWECDVESGS